MKNFKFLRGVFCQHFDLFFYRVKNFQSSSPGGLDVKWSSPECIPCKLHAEDMPIFTIFTIVICLIHAEDLWH